MKFRRRSSESLAGFLFVGPMILGLSVFTIIPILLMLFLSFSDWNIVMGLDWGSMKWVGFENFIKLADDQNFHQSLAFGLLSIFIPFVDQMIAQSCVAFVNFLFSTLHKSHDLIRCREIPMVLVRIKKEARFPCKN